MRRIVVSEFVSLDGVMEGPGPDDPFELTGSTQLQSGTLILTYRPAGN